MPPPAPTWPTPVPAATSPCSRAWTPASTSSPSSGCTSVRPTCCATPAGGSPTTGTALGFFPIDDHRAALREDVELLARTPFLSPVRAIAGFVYDVQTGLLDDVVRWEAGDHGAGGRS